MSIHGTPVTIMFGITIRSLAKPIFNFQGALAGIFAEVDPTGLAMKLTS